MTQPITRSPFYVIENFVSPLMCEDFIDMCNYTIPDTDKEGKDIASSRVCEDAEGIIFERLVGIVPDLQERYGFEYKGTERSQFEWFPQGTTGTLHAENSRYLRGKWLRVLPADLTCVLFLSDYQDKSPFDSQYEVYGGKLEFPQHHFGFNPQRGTLIVFPSDPHFINVTALAQVGDLHQVRFNIVAKAPYIYDGASFPGNYTNWFSDLA